MNVALKFKTIVWAGVLHPVELDRHFFVKNNIFNEAEILPMTQFGASGTLNLFTTKYNLTSNLIITTPNTPASPINQLVLNANIPSNEDDKINEKMISIIKAGNLTNCIGLGINFNWFITLDEGETSHEIGKSYFYSDKIALMSKFFNTEDAEYGVYVSKNFKNSRLKLDVKPIVYQKKLVSKRGYDFAFNFHFDIKNKDNNSEVIEILEKYNEFIQESETIISIYK